MIVSAFSLALSPVTSNLAWAYNVPQVEVNMCGIIFTATFVPFTFVSMWMYKNMRTSTVLRITCMVTLIGSWIRIICPITGFCAILLGQVIISCAQPLYYNVITLFTNAWFPDSERTLINTLCGLSIPGGNLTAFIMSGFIFKGVEFMDK